MHVNFFEVFTIPRTYTGKTKLVIDIFIYESNYTKDTTLVEMLHI